MYYEGQGVQQDYQLALELFARAAEQGDVQAQTKLGLMLAAGGDLDNPRPEHGIPQDYLSTYMWRDVAADSGEPRAQEERDLLANKMTAAQIVEAQLMARKRGSEAKDSDALSMRLHEHARIIRIAHPNTVTIRLLGAFSFDRHSNLYSFPFSAQSLRLFRFIFPATLTKHLLSCLQSMVVAGCLRVRFMQLVMVLTRKSAFVSSMRTSAHAKGSTI